MEQKSLFSVISPIMVGPSSSHTAGAVRLGLMARNIYKNSFSKVKGKKIGIDRSSKVKKKK